MRRDKAAELTMHQSEAVSDVQVLSISMRASFRVHVAVTAESRVLMLSNPSHLRRTTMNVRSILRLLRTMNLVPVMRFHRFALCAVEPTRRVKESISGVRNVTRLAYPGGYACCQALVIKSLHAA
jgi:hypothetical protein